MSWAEIKKAVNSNLDVPLNDWVDKVANDYLFFDMMDIQQTGGCYVIGAGSLMERTVEINSNAEIFAFGAFVPFGTVTAYGTSNYAKIIVKADNETLVDVKAQLNSGSSQVGYTVIWHAKESYDRFSTTPKNPYGITLASDFSNPNNTIYEASLNANYYKDQKSWTGMLSPNESLLPYIDDHKGYQTIERHLYWVNPKRSTINCNSFQLTIAGSAPSTAVSRMKGFVVYRLLE